MMAALASTLVVVPMKDPDASKTRLSGRLSPSDRRRFATLLLTRTFALLQGLRTSGGFDIAVVTQSDAAAQIARAHGAEVIEETEVRGLNAALTLAADWAAARGYRRMCVLPADLAAPDPDDLMTLLDHDGVVVCPASDQGTNALLVSPPTAIRFCYGPRSAPLHLSAAEAAGIAPVLLPLESLRFDIDTTDDLAHAFALLPDLKSQVGA